MDYLKELITFPRNNKAKKNDQKVINLLEKYRLASIYSNKCNSYKMLKSVFIVII